MNDEKEGLKKKIQELVQTTPIAGDFDRTRAVYANDAFIEKLFAIQDAHGQSCYKRGRKETENRYEKLVQILGSEHQEQVTRLKVALEYYADCESWDSGGFRGENSRIILCKNDNHPGWFVAKQALEEI